MRAVRDFLPAAFLAGLTGLAAAALPPGIVLFLGTVLAVGVAGAVWRSRSSGSRQSDRQYLPLVTLMIVVSTLSVSWIGVRGPGGVPISDPPFIAAMLMLGVVVVTGTAWLRPAVPPWLLVVAGGMIVAALLPLLLVPDPPPYALLEASAATIGAASSRATDLALLARVEYAMVFVPIVIAAVVTSHSRVRLLADVWFASAAVCALVGVLDTVFDAGIARTLVTDPPEGSGGPLRATGLTSHPNYLGLFAAMALPLGIVRMSQAKGRTRIFFAASVGILALAVQLSGSRIALLAVLVGVAVLLALAPAFRSRLALTLVGAAAVIGVLYLLVPSEQSAFERLSGDATADEATELRVEVIENSLDIGLENLLTGVGFSRILDSHSVPVQFLEAGGIIALVMLIVWIAGMLGLGTAMSRRGKVPAASAQIAAALTAALAAWLVTSIINPQLVERFLYVPAGILLGLAAVAAREARLERDRLWTSPQETRAAWSQAARPDAAARPKASVVAAHARVPRATS